MESAVHFDRPRSLLRAEPVLYGGSLPMSGRRGAGEAETASDHVRSTSALALELGVQPLRPPCQVLEEPPPAVQVR